MPVEDEISQTEVGVYHNLILENFIEIHKTPSVLASSSNADEFIRLMSDYGAAVRLAYKNNAPAGDIDRWVCDILDVSLNSRQSQLVDHIINGGLSATDAIKKVYGTNSISPLIFSYVDEIEKTIDQHGGTTPCENKLNLLYVNYIKSATNSEEKQLISWIAGVADGSYEYWDTQYTVWNPQLQGRFWNSTLRIGKRILISDVAGAIGYVAGSKLGWITGALTWKAVAATAGVASIIGGVDQLLEEIMSVKSTDTNTEYSVSREEIHKAYYIRVKELGL